MKSRWLVGVVALSAIMGVSGIGAAQSHDQSQNAGGFANGDLQIREEAAGRDAARKQELTTAILAARETASNRRFSPALRGILAGKLQSASLASLEAFANKGGLGNIDALAGDTPRTQVLGDSAADLIFTPVTPCRIINTTVAGGAISGNTQRNFFVNGNTAGVFETQGGTAGGCNIPDAATAVEMNFVAVGPAGAGDFRAFPWNAAPTVPNASVINYASVTGLNIANGLAQPVCNAATTTCTFDLIVQADVSTSHLVVDVVGYYQKATEGVGTHTETVRTTPITLTTACQNITSCTVANASNAAAKVMVQAAAHSRLNHTGGGDDVVEVTLAANGTTCTSPFAWGTESGWAHVDNVIGTSCCFENTITPMKTFNIAANTTSTFFLNGRMSFDSGAAAPKGLDSANIQCTVLK